MQIEVLYFGTLREISGQRREFLDISEEDNVSSVLRILCEKYGSAFKDRIEDRDRYGILIDGRHYETVGGIESSLKDGDQVAFLPVTMGG